MNSNTLHLLLDTCITLVQGRRLYSTKNHKYITRFSDIFTEVNQSFESWYPIPQVLTLSLEPFNDVISAGIVYICFNLLSIFKSNQMALYEHLLNKTLSDTFSFRCSSTERNETNSKSNTTPSGSNSLNTNDKQIDHKETLIEVCVPLQGRDYFFEDFPKSGKINWYLFESLSYTADFKEMIGYLRRSHTGVLVQKSIDERSKEILVSNRIPFIDTIGERKIKQIQRYTGMSILQDHTSLFNFTTLCQNFNIIGSKISYTREKIYGEMLLKFTFYEVTYHSKKNKTNTDGSLLATRIAHKARLGDIDRLVDFHVLLLICLLRDNHIDEPSISFFKEKHLVHQIVYTILRTMITLTHLL